MFKIRTETLADLLPFHPFICAPWDCAPLIESEILQENPVSYRLIAEGKFSREVHQGRVRYLMDNWVNDGKDAPEVEICQGIYVYDGYHRIAAAIVRKDEFIYTDVFGFLDDAEELGFEEIIGV